VAHAVVIAAAAMCVGLLGGVAGPPRVLVSSMSAADAAAVIARYQARIPELMAEEGIPGLSVALVDRDGVLWTEGFGHLDRDGSPAVTTDTLFGVQSMSKNFTATAVMQAVGAGKVRLDEPITSYLPDFTVRSAFEEHPERKITMRMLLSHTAGFTHEAPVGNNFERETGTFEEHVASISDTWLRFPVGTGYAYSNLGMDLAGYILERVYDKPFATLMGELLLRPLGMERSTFDRSEILAATDRAVGHSGPARDMPPFDAMTAAGGLYSSADDLARYLRFQLNGGSLDGRQVLDPGLMEQMRTVPAPHANEPAGYALGLIRHRWVASGNADLFNHGGGGMGFLSDLWWSPPLGIGVAVLTNSADHDLQTGLALDILGDLAHQPGSVYNDRLLALPAQASAAEPDGAYLAPAGMADLVSGAGMVPRGDESERWASYSGSYRTRRFGMLDPATSPARFFVDSGVPFFDADEEQGLVHHRLTEVEPGLFLTEDGQTLDVRGPTPTWRNLDLVRISGGPAPWQWALLGATVCSAIWWLIAALVSRTQRRRRPAEPPEGSAMGHQRWRRLTDLAALLTATFAIGTIALVAVLPGLVDSGFLGWLDFPLAQRLALHLPMAFAIATGCLVALGVVGWTRGWRTRAFPRRDAALVATSVALTVQLFSWNLIGWGLT
jgi:CubicO group peptidase (beta-lactamase class C family)